MATSFAAIDPNLMWYLTLIVLTVALVVGTVRLYAGVDLSVLAMAAGVLGTVAFMIGACGGGSGPWASCMSACWTKKER